MKKFFLFFCLFYNLIFPVKSENVQQIKIIHMNRIIERRLAIITDMDYDDSNPYTIQLVACGRQGRTSRKYLEPTD